MDLETVEFNSIQTPLTISFASEFETDNGYIVVKSEVLLNREGAPKGETTDLWENFIEYVKNLKLKGRNHTVFVHNLGGFDGYFIYKGLLQVLAPNQVETLIDAQNKFILIKANLGVITLEFKDSYRMFPVKLTELCKIYKVEGKLGEYKQEYNNLTILDDVNKEHLADLISYNKQDSLALYNAISQAQQSFYFLHKIDICNNVSTSSIALNIFRAKFLQKDIPVLTGMQDRYIRAAYFGRSYRYLPS